MPGLYALVDGATSSGSAFDFSTLDFGQVLPTMTAALGVGIGVAISVLVVKKGVNYVMSWIKRA